MIGTFSTQPQLQKFGLSMENEQCSHNAVFEPCRSWCDAHEQVGSVISAGFHAVGKDIRQDTAAEQSVG